MIVYGEPKFSQFTGNFSNISGNAGLSYEATKELTLKFNLARGFRAPTLAELASNGAHEGTIRYEIGSEHVSIDASLFYDHIKNFIFYEKVQNAAGGDSIIVDPETGDELDVFR